MLAGPFLLEDQLSSVHISVILPLPGDSHTPEFRPPGESKRLSVRHRSMFVAGTRGGGVTASGLCS